MRLKDMKRSRASDSPFVGTLTDSTGETYYEIAMSGPIELIQKAFGKVDFQYEIDPRATDADAAEKHKKIWLKLVGTDGSAQAHETIAALTKRIPRRRRPRTPSLSRFGGLRERERGGALRFRPFHWPPA